MASQGALVTRQMQGPDSNFLATAAFSFENVFLAFSTFTFAFTGQFMIIEIMSEMKNPSQFPKAYICMAAPFQAVSYLLVGVGGYYFIGDKATGMIVDNIPFGPAFQVAGFCLFTHMIVTYLMKGIVICRAVHNFTDKDADNDDSRAAWNTWGVLVLGAVILSWLISSIVPFFNQLVDLVGASVTPISCYIIPVLCYIRWIKDFAPKDYPLRNFETLVIIVEIASAVLLLVFGTFFSVRSIFDEWGTFGPPFACHCEDMWNTCQCSSTHAGMWSQCEAAAKEIAIELASQVRAMVDPNFIWLSQLSLA